MVHPINQVLDLDALLLVITGPVLSSCPVAPVIVTLTMARRAQWEGSTDLARYVVTTPLFILLGAVTPTTAPGCVVPGIKTLSSFSTGTGTISTSTLSPALYTIATIITTNTMTTPVSTEC